MHHPMHSPTTGAKNFFFVPIGGGRTPRVPADAQLSPILRKHGVDVVFAGHTTSMPACCPRKASAISCPGRRPKTYGFEAVAATSPPRRLVSLRFRARDTHVLHVPAIDSAGAVRDSGWGRMATPRTGRCRERHRGRGSLRRVLPARALAPPRSPGPRRKRRGRGSGGGRRSPPQPEDGRGPIEARRDEFLLAVPPDLPPMAAALLPAGRVDAPLRGRLGQRFRPRGRARGRLENLLFSSNVRAPDPGRHVRRGLAVVGGGRAHPAALARGGVLDAVIDPFHDLLASPTRALAVRAPPLRVEDTRKASPSKGWPRGHGPRRHRAEVARAIRAAPPEPRHRDRRADAAAHVDRRVRRGGPRRRCVGPAFSAPRASFDLHAGGGATILGPSARDGLSTSGIARRGSSPLNGGRSTPGARSRNGKRAATGPVGTRTRALRSRCASRRRSTRRVALEGVIPRGPSGPSTHHRLRVFAAVGRRF